MPSHITPGTQKLNEAGYENSVAPDSSMQVTEEIHQAPIIGDASGHQCKCV